MDSRLLRIPEVAHILSVNTDRVYALIRGGFLPVVRVGRQVRVDDAQLRIWINQGGQALSGGWRHKEKATR